MKGPFGLDVVTKQVSPGQDGHLADSGAQVGMGTWCDILMSACPQPTPSSTHLGEPWLGCCQHLMGHPAGPPSLWESGSHAQHVSQQSRQPLSQGEEMGCEGTPRSLVPGIMLRCDPSPWPSSYGAVSPRYRTVPRAQLMSICQFLCGQEHVAEGSWSVLRRPDKTQPTS